MGESGGVRSFWRFYTAAGAFVEDTWYVRGVSERRK